MPGFSLSSHSPEKLRLEYVIAGASIKCLFMSMYAKTAKNILRFSRPLPGWQKPLNVPSARVWMLKKPFPHPIFAWVPAGRPFHQVPFPAAHPSLVFPEHDQQGARAVPNHCSSQKWEIIFSYLTGMFSARKLLRSF